MTTQRLTFLVGFIHLISSFSLADKPKVRVDEISTSEDTTISIKKGPSAAKCVEYQIVDGQDEVSGNPEFDRSKGYASWQSACAEWKKQMREMNRGNQMITLNCNTAKGAQDEGRYVFQSNGTYKVKIRIKEIEK